jgi:hypothetical protein
MELLAAIEQLALVRALKASFVAYPIVNALHIASIGALLTSVALIDFRIIGGLRSIPMVPFVVLLRRVALAAFVCALLTGSLMFSVRAREYAAMPVFLLKMVLILLAGANFLLFLHLSSRSKQDGPSPAPTMLVILSLVLWAAVLFAGRFIGFL